MKYSGHRKLLYKLSKLSKFNAFNLLGYKTNTDASILVYKFRPKRSGFNVYAEYIRPQLTLLCITALVLQYSFKLQALEICITVQLFLYKLVAQCCSKKGKKHRYGITVWWWMILPGQIVSNYLSIPSIYLFSLNS